jgi:ADP-heptose:LPS heptosyltransferase
LQRAVHLFRPNRSAPPLPALRPRRLLVLESHVLGDLVMTVPLLERLRERYPDAEITLATHAPASKLYGVRRLVDRVISLPMPWQPGGRSGRNLREFGRGILALRRLSFDLAVTSWGDLRDALLFRVIGAVRRAAPVYGGGYFLLTDAVPLPSGAHHLGDLRTALLKALGEDMDARPLSPPRLTVNPDVIGAGGGVVIHPGASRVDKMWSVDACATAARRLVATGASVTLVGSADDRARLEAIRAAVGADVSRRQLVRVALPTLDELAGLLASADVAVTMDSAASHIASAVGTPVVVLFGPTTPENCGARGDVPVRYLQSADGTLDGIDVDVVVRTVRELTAARPKRDRQDEDRPSATSRRA